MTKLKLLIGALTILLTSAFVIYQSVDWKVKDDYIVKFRFGKYTFGVDSMPAPNYGTIKGLKASVSFDKDNLEKSKIIASIDAKTIDTGEPSKNSSAIGPDVLIADKFPLMTFESTSITKTSNGYEATGKLTIKNISKEIKFPFVFEKETFNGGFTIDTKDFNFTHPHVPKEITVFFTIPVAK
jgi:polyisoprenoid-binding protein YceI